MNMSKQLKEGLSLFIDKYSLFFTSYRSGKIIDLFVELVKSLSGLISTFEVRLRNLPGSLDSKINKLLARNLFLTSWYGCTDIGYKRNQHLFLNEEWYERVMDEILSGDFSNDLGEY